MRTTALLLLLIAGARPAPAQNAKLDALNRLLSKATTDTARVNLNVRKAGLLAQVNLDSALALGERTVAFSRKIAYPVGEARARLKLVTAYCFKGNFAEARKNLRRAEALFSAQPDSADFGLLYSSYGMLHGMLSQYDSATVFYEKAIRLARQANDLDLLGTSYQNLAISYQMQSNYQQALAYFQKGLTLAEEKNDPSSQAYALTNMGMTYKTVGDTVRAERALLDAIRMAKRAGVRNVELYAYSNLASVYDLERKYAKSYQYAIQAAVLAEQTGDPGIQSASLSKAAWALATQKQYFRAEAMNKRAMVIADSSHQPLNIFQVYSTMGSIFKVQGKYAAALPYLERAFRALDRADMYDEQISAAYADLALCYEKTGDFKKALLAFKTSAEITDSVRSKESIRKTTEQNMNFEFGKKQEIAQAEQQASEAGARSRQWALGAGLVLAVALMVLTFLGYRTKQRDNALLEFQKEEIQNTLTQLRATQAQLIQSEKMASLGELTAGIAHEIQNPLNFVNNFSDVSTELIGELKEEVAAGRTDEVLAIADDLTQNLQKITYHGQRASAIVRGMLEHSRTDGGQKEPTNLNALTDEYLRLAYHGLRAKNKEFNAELKTDFDPKLGKVQVAPQELGRVLLNLFNNAFYAVAEKQNNQNRLGLQDLTGLAGLAPYQPTVSVSTARVNGQVVITVSDNGTGMPESVREKIFQPFFTTKPTGSGTGLGLSLSYDIVTKGHGGTISVASTQGQGTEFTVRLPA